MTRRGSNPIHSDASVSAEAAVSTDLTLVDARAASDQRTRMALGIAKMTYEETGSPSEALESAVRSVLYESKTPYHAIRQVLRPIVEEVVQSSVGIIEAVQVMKDYTRSGPTTNRRPEAAVKITPSVFASVASDIVVSALRDRFFEDPDQFFSEGLRNLSLVVEPKKSVLIMTTAVTRLTEDMSGVGEDSLGRIHSVVESLATSESTEKRAISDQLVQARAHIRSALNRFGVDTPEKTEQEELVQGTLFS